MPESPHIRLSIEVSQYRNRSQIRQSHTENPKHDIFEYHHTADHFHTHAYGAEHTDFLGSDFHPVV